MNSGENEVADEWGDDFLHQLIQVEQLALSSQQQQQHQEPPTFISYSPPRELSQRPAIHSSDPSPPRLLFKSSPSTNDSSKNLEIQRLKKELGRVSKQLTQLEHECFQLKKERNDKEELDKLGSAKNEEEVANIHKWKDTNSKFGVFGMDPLGASEQFQNAKASNHQVGPQISRASSSSKAIGVQVDLHTHLDLSKKLQAIWSSPSDQKSGKSLISKLFVDCSLEFRDLFGWMSINTLTKPTSSLAVKSSDVKLQYHMHSCPSPEAAKVSHLYSVLTEITSGMIRLEALLGPLLDLCSVENVVIVSRSLHILHVFLKQLLTFERKAEERDNVIVEGVLSGSNIGDIHGSSSAKNRQFFVSEDEVSYGDHMPFRTRPPDAETLCKKEHWSPGRTISSSGINWVSLFELMLQIAMKNTEEYARSEAVSIMNMIVMSNRSYMERERFGQKLVLKSISQLLKHEAGLCVQKEALHLLYLLLNCPKVFVAFCCGCKEVGNAGAVDINQDNSSAAKDFSMILEGLADCIACRGNGLQELELRRNAVILLAFLASSGVSGFEILVNHKLNREANFLMLILQVLVSEMDTEAAGDTVPAENFKARTLLMREALILLNRLVSNPAYSAIVLQILTGSRDMASLTIDVANRFSRKDPRLGESNPSSRQMRESEVVDLGRVFRKRVFTFLGENIS
ncbi:protein SENSITIVE TO UV 2 [Pistacia vera]|uniref:protein SENSITIVE TO UV 2 n=1 Tax=Pistacia vera TaxID=55513 RepID=UPI0012632F34|nr:protein SENSITIVE TO UV 2 [Pistacia vera]